MAALQLGGRGDLPGHADERVLRRLVAVGRREVARAAGCAGCSTGCRRSTQTRPMPELVQQVEQRVRLVEVDAQARCRRRRRRSGTAPASRSGSPTAVVAGLGTARKSNAESRTPIPGPGPRRGCRRRSRGGTAVRFGRGRRRSGPAGRRALEQLVAEVAVAVLDVDEVEPGLPRQHRGVDEVARPARRARRR